MSFEKQGHVFQERAGFGGVCGLRVPSREFTSAETRRIGSFPGNTVLADSEGRGWRNVHASFAKVNTWSGVHHAHDHHCIAYCVNQPAFLRRRVEGGRDEAMTMRPRQFFLIPGRRSSEWHRRGETEMLMIYLRQDLLDALAGEMRSLGGGVRAPDVDLVLGTTDPLLEQIALAILTTLQRDEDGSSALYVDGLAHAAALHLLRGRIPGGRQVEPAPRLPPPRSGLRRVRDYIEAELAGDLSLTALAAQAGLPATMLARAFRECLGTSPHQYVLERRLERARTLLLSTDMPIAEIAFETGFSSQSHLTTAFGRLTGLPPAQYRRSGADDVEAPARPRA